MTPADTVAQLAPALHAEVVRSGWRLVEALERMRPDRARALLRDHLDAQARHTAETLSPLVRWPAVPERALRVYTNKPDQVRMRRVLDFIEPGDRVLDIGAGWGYLTGVIMRDSGASYYCGIDLGEHIVESARQMIAANGLQGRVESHLEPKDLYTLTPDWVARHDPDLLICCEVLEHVADAEKALATIGAAMPSRSALLFTVPILGRLEACWGHLSLFDAERIRTMVARASLHVQCVEPLFNTWALVLVSPSSEPLPRLRRILDRPSATPPRPLAQSNAFRRVRMAAENVQPGRWCTGARTEVSFDRQGAHITVTAEETARIRRLAGVTAGRAAEVRGGLARLARRALGRRRGGPAGGGGPERAGSHYGGVAFPVDGVRAVRLEMRFQQPGSVRAVFVDGYDGARRVARWQWSVTEQLPPRGLTTYVLRPGEPTSPFAPVGDADAALATRVDVFVEVRRGTSAGFDLRRVAYVG